METGLTLPDEATFKTDIQAINRFQDVVHQNLKPGQDYGVIPGTSKPTLLKPGAEKITKLLGLCDRYEVLDRQEDWVKPFFRYLIKCQLVPVNSEAVITEGFGECNSMEAKYRWRESKRKCPMCGAEAIIKGKEEYGGGWICFKKVGGCGAKWGDSEIEGQAIGRVENEDIYSQVNTLIKMAKKRALVDAALSAGRLSNVFTQDVEDMEEFKTEMIVKQTESKETEPKLGAETLPPPSKVDMDWLKESLKELKWSGAEVSRWLKEHYPEVKGRPVGTLVKTLVENLTLEHQGEFVKEVQKRLEEASREVELFEESE